MRDLNTKYTLLVFVALLLMAGRLHAYSHDARPQGQIAKGSKTSTERAKPTPPSSSLQLPAVVQQKAREPISITYQDGELSIDAFNAPLSDILRAVRNRTGALMDIPPGATERVNRQIGPGRVIVVLGSLLNESNFNYLIEDLGSGQAAPVRVTLSSKDGTYPPRPVRAPEARVAAAVAAGRQPVDDAPRQQAMADRSRLLRQIMSDRGQFMFENVKDRTIR